MFNFEMPNQFRLANHRLHVIIIGLGGTGGYLFPNIARVIYQLNADGRKDIMLTAVDGDIIEHKNVNRQNFFLPDVGKNKADLMTTRHGRLFGEQYGTVKQYIEDEETLEEVIFQDDRFPIIVSCVDNHKTRQLIHRVYEANPEKMIWVDSGNEHFTGQVVVGYKSDRKVSETPFAEPTMFHMPSIIEVFPDILSTESRFNSEISCDEMAVDNIQNIAANITAATQLFIQLNILIGDNAEQGYLTTHMVEFNSKSGLCSAKPTTYSNLTINNEVTA